MAGSTTIRVTAATKRLLESLHANARRHDPTVTQQDIVDKALAIASRHPEELLDDRPLASPSQLAKRLQAMTGPYGDLSGRVDQLVYGE